MIQNPQHQILTPNEAFLYVSNEIVKWGYLLLISSIKSIAKLCACIILHHCLSKRLLYLHLLNVKSFPRSMFHDTPRFNQYLEAKMFSIKINVVKT